MENKLRIQRAEEDFYRINIADDGTEIVFDLADISLPMKCDKAFNDVEANKNNTLARIKAIENKYKNQTPNTKLESQQQREVFEAYNEMFKKNREIMDKFFGLEGAMQKIFGDANYVDMYNDLYEQLEPHFKKMELNVGKIKERIEKKYGKQDNVIR